MTKFFVEVNGQNQGPYDLPTLQEKLARGEVSADSRLFDPQISDWITVKAFIAMCAEVSQNANHRPDVKAPSSAVTSTLPAVDTDEWFVLKGENKYGPYTYLDIIKLVQEKSLFQFDFVWRKGLEQWNRIAEIPDFSHDRIRNLVLAETDKQVVDVFARRKHKRVNYECEVVAHDNKSLWKGKCVELSIGGAGIVFENSLLLPGNKIYLHFLPGSLSTPFNVLSEVVSKKYTKGIRSQGTPVIYGVKFINLHRNDHEQIKAVTDAA